MENNNNNQNEKEPEKKSWLERNLWMVAVSIAIFMLRMCHEFSR